MTNKEIKFELARIALERCSFTTSETLNESLKNLYEWVIAEDEAKEKEQEQTDYSSISIEQVVWAIQKRRRSSGIAAMMINVFAANDIKTVDDLLRFGRYRFAKCRTVGQKSLWAIEEALEELGITNWN